MMEQNFTDAAIGDVTENPDGSAVVSPPLEEEKQAQDHYSNLAEDLSVFELNTLATDLLELIERDKEARKKRDEQQEEGIKRTGLSDEAPGGATFPGASRTVHPVLAEGCVDFAARSMKELFPAKGPVKTKLIGKDNRDALDKARRKRDFLNHQLTTKIVEYRSEKEVMLTQLPLGGSQYEKYWFDHGMKRIRMEFVPVDELLLPYAAASFYTSPRMTHVQNITKQMFEDRIRSDLYVDVDNLFSEQSPEQSESAKANEKVEGKTSTGYNEDGLRTVYETHCWRELEGDEVPRPYIVHLDHSLSRVLGVYRNYEPTETSVGSSSSGVTEKLEWFVENKFIPWRGAYGIGLLHLIGSLAASMTGAVRALLDSAHINNTPTAVRLKGGRASGQNITIDATAVQEIEAPAGTDDIRKVMMALPFNPPSVVLFQLLQWLTDQAKGVVSTAEERIADASNNMPVGTALALIEQGSQVFSAIHGRLHAAQAQALRIICRLVKQNATAYAEELNRFGLSAEDFDDNDDIEPVSDPNIFSEAQRYAQLQEELKLVSIFPDLGWNRFELAKRALELLRVDHSDEVLPKPPEPFSGDPVSENMRALFGAPLKAVPDQDHIAHLKEHIRALNDPLLGGNPLFPGQLLQNILANCAQHIVFIYAAAGMTAGAVRIAQTGGQNREMAVADAAADAMLAVNQQLPGLVEALTKAQQLVQSKMPPPPQDPAIAATLQAAMAETERRKAVDAQTFQLKQAEFQRDTQFIQQDKKLDALKAQLQMMMNQQDNAQHASTEIAKNKQDSQTSIIVAQMRERASMMAQQDAQNAELINRVMEQIMTPNQGELA